MKQAQVKLYTVWTLVFMSFCSISQTEVPLTFDVQVDPYKGSFGGRILLFEMLGTDEELPVELTYSNGYDGETASWVGSNWRLQVGEEATGPNQKRLEDRTFAGYADQNGNGPDDADDGLWIKFHTHEPTGILLSAETRTQHVFFVTNASTPDQYGEVPSALVSELWGSGYPREDQPEEALLERVLLTSKTNSGTVLKHIELNYRDVQEAEELSLFLDAVFPVDQQHLGVSLSYNNNQCQHLQQVLFDGYELAIEYDLHAYRFVQQNPILEALPLQAFSHDPVYLEFAYKPESHEGFDLDAYLDMLETYWNTNNGKAVLYNPAALPSGIQHVQVEAFGQKGNVLWVRCAPSSGEEAMLLDGSFLKLPKIGERMLPSPRLYQWTLSREGHIEAGHTYTYQNENGLSSGVVNSEPLALKETHGLWVDEAGMVLAQLAAYEEEQEVGYGRIEVLPLTEDVVLEVYEFCTFRDLQPVLKLGAAFDDGVQHYQLEQRNLAGKLKGVSTYEAHVLAADNWRDFPPSEQVRYTYRNRADTLLFFGPEEGELLTQQLQGDIKFKRIGENVRLWVEDIPAVVAEVQHMKNGAVLYEKHLAYRHNSQQEAVKEQTQTNWIPNYSLRFSQVEEELLTQVDVTLSGESANPLRDGHWELPGAFVSSGSKTEKNVQTGQLNKTYTWHEGDWALQQNNNRFDQHGRAVEQRDGNGVPSACLYTEDLFMRMRSRNATPEDLYFENFSEGRTVNAGDTLCSMLPGEVTVQKGMEVQFWGKTKQRNLLYVQLGSHSFPLEMVKKKGKKMLYKCAIPAQYFHALTSVDTLVLRLQAKGEVSMDNLRVQPLESKGMCFVYDPDTGMLLQQFDERHWPIQ